jgi:hypothetical protein
VLLLRRLELVTMAVMACVTVGIAIADMVGVLDDVPWLRARIPVITLLALGAFAAYLLTEQFSQNREQKNYIDAAILKALQSVSGVEVRRFQTRADFYRYAAERIKSSNNIDDLTWGPVPASAMTADDQIAYQEYRKAVAAACTGRGEAKKKAFREVMSFPAGARVDRAAPLMDKGRYPNYHLRYYDYDHHGSPVLLQYYIFDKSEVLISSRTQATASLDNQFASIKSRELAEVMSHYFEVIWRDAILLKDSVTVETGRLAEISTRHSKAAALLRSYI